MTVALNGGCSKPLAAPKPTTPGCSAPSKRHIPIPAALACSSKPLVSLPTPSPWIAKQNTRCLQPASAMSIFACFRRRISATVRKFGTRPPAQSSSKKQAGGSPTSMVSRSTFRTAAPSPRTEASSPPTAIFTTPCSPAYKKSTPSIKT